MDPLAIHAAYQQGDLEALQRLLGHPLDFPNCLGPRGVGEIILEYAIYHSPLSFIRTLFDLGADPNYSDAAGFPSLLATASTDRPDRCEIAELLLTRGADIHQRGVNDYTPLHLAAARNDFELIQVLLAHGADPRARTRIDDCSTPLDAVLHLLGYFPKARAVVDGKEICSVSQCIQTAPEGWIGHWLHNEFAFYNSRADARRIAPFDVYAYRIWPRRYKPGVVEDLVVPALAAEPLPPGFKSLGFDVVSKSVSTFFECAPLSCNGLAAELPVNAHCLLDDLRQALAFAARCAIQQPEPGDYYVIEVLREN